VRWNEQGKNVAWGEGVDRLDWNLFARGKILEGGEETMSKDDPGTKVALRFLFANHDGVYTILEFSLDTTQEDVKRALLEAWPSNVEEPDSIRRFRLFAFGRELENSSTKTLKALNIKANAKDTKTGKIIPTPVNVSLLPKSFATPTHDRGSKASPGSAGGCCIVM